MPKRKRTRTRTEEALSLAVTSTQQGWNRKRVSDELEGLIARNSDLIDEKSIETFRSEFYRFADPRLNGFLPKIDGLAKRKIDAQEAGGKLRYNHELSKFCKRALDHPMGPEVAIREIESEL
jgi:hypothetical protein